MKSKIKFLIVIVYIVLLSFYASDALKKNFLDVTNSVIAYFDSFLIYSRNLFDEHFDQAENIAKLREENKKLKEATILLDAFNYELNDLLKDHLLLYTIQDKLKSPLYHIQEQH